MARNDTLGLWMVSRHDEVVAVSRDPETFCSSKGIMTFEIGAEYPTPPTMMHTDPPDHTRYRTLVQPGFRPSYMRALEPGIRGRVRALVDRIEPGVPVDVVADLAVPLPLQVISDLLGVPEEEWPTFFRWSEAVIPGATDWPEDERARLSGDMVTYLLAAAADRRASPKDDIISELAAAEVDGDQLTDAELGHVPGAAPGGRQRDHPQHDVRWPGRVRRAPGPVGGAGRPLRRRRQPGAAPGRRGDAAVDHPGGGLHAHHHPRRRARWPVPRRR